MIKVCFPFCRAKYSHICKKAFASSFLFLNRYSYFTIFVLFLRTANRSMVIFVTYETTTLGTH